jgi:hypothetical protein
MAVVPAPIVDPQLPHAVRGRGSYHKDPSGRKTHDLVLHAASDPTRNSVQICQKLSSNPTFLQPASSRRFGRATTYLLYRSEVSEVRRKGRSTDKISRSAGARGNFRDEFINVLHELRAYPNNC